MLQQRVIILHVQKAEDILFKPAVLFSNKRLIDPMVEEFLIEEAEKLPVRTRSITLLFQFVQNNAAIEERIVNAIRVHFTYGSEKADRMMKNTLRLGCKSLVQGFVFLILMVIIAIAINTFFPGNTIMITFRELFIILGWVALWRPADLLLYEWRSHKRMSVLLKRLARSEVKFQ